MSTESIFTVQEFYFYGRWVFFPPGCVAKTKPVKDVRSKFLRKRVLFTARTVLISVFPLLCHIAKPENKYFGVCH